MQILNHKKSFILLFLLGLWSFGAFAQNKKAATKNPTPVKHVSGVIVKSKPIEKDTFVDIITSFGTMRVRLFKETPLHRSNFINLAASGFYDSLLFHRIIKGFMIQGGDPESKNADSSAMLGNGDVGYRIPAEFNKKYYHKKGALAAARDNNPEMASSGCQFYIVQGRKFTATELTNMINNVNYNHKMMMLQEYTERDTVKVRLQDYNMRGDQQGLEKYMQVIKNSIDKDFESKMYMPTPIQVSEYINHGGAPHLDGSYTVFGEVITGFEVIDKIADQKTNTMARPYDNVRMSMKLVIQ